MKVYSVPVVMDRHIADSYAGIHTHEKVRRIFITCNSKEKAEAIARRYYVISGEVCIEADLGD